MRIAAVVHCEGCEKDLTMVSDFCRIVDVCQKSMILRPILEETVSLMQVRNGLPCAEQDTMLSPVAMRGG